MEKEKMIQNTNKQSFWSPLHWLLRNSLMIDGLKLPGGTNSCGLSLLIISPVSAYGFFPTWQSLFSLEKMAGYLYMGTSKKGVF